MMTMREEIVEMEEICKNKSLIGLLEEKWQLWETKEVVVPAGLLHLWVPSNLPSWWRELHRISLSSSWLTALILEAAAMEAGWTQPIAILSKLVEYLPKPHTHILRYTAAASLLHPNLQFRPGKTRLGVTVTTWKGLWERVQFRRLLALEEMTGLPITQESSQLVRPE